MEFFKRAKVVRLKSQHQKFLIADPDEESIKQNKNGSATNVRWSVEFVEGKPNLIRLKSSQTWKYLRASDEPFLLGMTGKKVVQGSPRLRSDPSVEWEPVRDGQYLKLRTRKGQYLRANGPIWPWRNSVTHDSPNSTAGNEWVLWIVDLLEFEHGIIDNFAATTVDDDNVHGGRLVSGKPMTENGRFSSNFSTQRPSLSQNSSAIPSPTPSLQRMKMDSGASSVSSINHKPTPDDDFLESDYEDSEEEEEEEHHSPAPPVPVEVLKAEQTLKEAKDLDFATAYNSGHLDKVEEAISILLSNNYIYYLRPPGTASQAASSSNSNGVHEQIQSLITVHDSAAVVLDEYNNLLKNKSELNAGVQEIVSKVKELERIEEQHNDAVSAAIKKREELLRMLKQVEDELKAAKALVEEDRANIEQMCNLIGRKQVAFMAFDKEQKVLNVKKVEADKKMDKVETEWAAMKLSALQMLERRS